MPTKIVLGLQHGDEGKGRVVDDLVQTWADVVVRFQGGGNAGHTVYDKEGNKFVTHILPVGVLNKSKFNFIAKGCVINIIDLFKEIKELNVLPENLLISGNCPLIEPTHLIKDKIKYQGKLGTTGRGIGPAYSEFYARDSILFKDFIKSPKEVAIKIQDKFFDYQTFLAELGIEGNSDVIEENFRLFNKWFNEYNKAHKLLEAYLCSNENIIQEIYSRNSNILLEGAQGSGLSIYSNNYPDVTSSSPSVGEALNSTGLNHKQIDEVIGVIKSYKTKVGSGSFPSRCDPVSEDVLSKIGKEFGATTGRPRKCGWLDLDEVIDAVNINGVDHICVIKSDVFCNIKEPYVYHEKELKSISKINSVSLEDSAFVDLLNIIKTKTGVNKVSFTTGPKRGEIVWNV
jgi:adenylosuccinate synthase